MITRFSILTAALPALVLSLSSLRAADAWESDFEKAKAAAAKDNKDILMDFTGSDWCPMCIQLSREVFEKDTFKQAAPKDFVLMEVDFPKLADEVPEPLAKQNEELKVKYSIEEFPTIILADAQGRPYAVTSYEKGGPAHYLEHLGELRKKHAERDAALKKAAAAKGVEKAKLTVEALKHLNPGLIFTFYQKEIDEAIAADKEDVTGVKKSRDEFATEAGFKAKVEKLETELAELHDKKKYKEFTGRIDKFIADEKLTGRRKQELIMAKLNVCEDDMDAASKILDEVIAVDPESEMSEQAKAIQETLKEEIKKQAKDGKKPAKEKDAEEEDSKEKDKPKDGDKPAEKEKKKDKEDK